MEYADELASIPLRRANTRDDLVIEIGFTDTTSGHKLSLSRESSLTGPLWIESPDATVTPANLRMAVAKMRNMAEYNLLPQQLWETLNAEEANRRRTPAAD